MREEKVYQHDAEVLILIAFGSGLVQSISEKEDINNTDDGLLLAKLFRTADEARAYITGIKEMQTWSDYCIVKPEDIIKYASLQEESNNKIIDFEQLNLMELINEISIIAAIISDHYAGFLYARNGEYLKTMQIITDTAKEFHSKFQHIDWDSAFNGDSQLEYKELFEKCNCWDDVVIEWAGRKIQGF